MKESRPTQDDDVLDALRATRLNDDYAAAFDEWDDGGDAAAWEATAADGLEPR